MYRLVAFLHAAKNSGRAVSGPVARSHRSSRIASSNPRNASSARECSGRRNAEPTTSTTPTDVLTDHSTSGAVRPARLAPTSPGTAANNTPAPIARNTSRISDRNLRHHGPKNHSRVTHEAGIMRRESSPTHGHPSAAKPSWRRPTCRHQCTSGEIEPRQADCAANGAL